MIKMVVFDWNGTLLADISAILEGANMQMKALKRPPITIAKYREHHDVPLSHFYKNLGIDEAQYKANAIDMSRRFHAFYEPRVARARTRGGARQLLETLKNKNIRLVLLSNHTMEGIYLQTERLKLSHYFEAILANENIHIAHKVGKQDRLALYLQSKEIQPDQVVIVGDTVEEVRIGKNLGLKSIAITGGFNSRKRLKLAKPDVLINKLNELTAALDTF